MKRISEINKVGTAINASVAILAPTDIIEATAFCAKFYSGGLAGLFNRHLEVLFVVLRGEIFGLLWDGHHC
jgi:hypothetical protein